MKTRITLLLAAMLAVGVGLSVARADDKAVRKELDAAYAKVAQAYKEKNLDALKAMATPDFTWKARNGQTSNLDQVGANLKKEFAAMKSMNEFDIKITG